MRACVVCFFVGFVLAGCGAVSEHPLSDESDSVVDRRLIGWWQEESEVAENKPGLRIAVGRAEGTERTLEVASITIEKHDRLRVERHKLHATKIADAWYASMSLKDMRISGEGEKIKTLGKGYALMRYSIEGDFLQLALLDDDGVGAEIDAKKIAGTVSKGRLWKDGKWVPQYDEVVLTATKPALRAWIAKAPETIWKPAAKRLRKILKKKGGD